MNLLQRGLKCIIDNNNQENKKQLIEELKQATFQYKNLNGFLKGIEI